MKPYPLPARIGVLVCDGTKALLLRNEGDALSPRLATVSAIDNPQPPSRELGTDRPGRLRSSDGAARSATDEGDLHDQAETDFLVRVAAMLEEAVRGQEIKELVLVAPPRALGVLRGKLSAAVKEIVSEELAKDLTKLPVDQIAKHLLAA
nr:host attachment family protein [uncultured Roseococcus sp.]